MTVRLIQGDVRDRLAELPDGSVQTCVTSPPYYGLRDYGVPGQIGLEPTLAEYVASLVQVFREVRRVLRDDGTLWLNIGDSYSGAGTTGGATEKQATNIGSFTGVAIKRDLKPKDLMMVPARVALALQDDGWYLRSDIIWHKPNPMPESVTDRPTSSHEHIFLLTKRKTYYYDADAIRSEGEPYRVKAPDGWDTGEGAHGSFHRNGRETGAVTDEIRTGANARNVWTIATAPFTGWTKTDRQKSVALDAVDDDTMRTPSEDCPVHAWPGRSDPIRVGDERAADVSNRNPGSGDRRALVPPVGSAPTDPHHVETTPGGNSDSLDLACSDAAIPHSNGTSRTGRAPATSSTYTPSARTPGHIDDTSGSPELYEPHPGTTENSISSGGSAENPLQETIDRIADTSSEHQFFEACTCSYHKTVTESITHFATFPPELPRRCILAGTSEKGACPACGAPWVRCVERTPMGFRPSERHIDREHAAHNGVGTNLYGTMTSPPKSETTGWQPSCTCNAGDPVPCVVLDPFAGAGTTLLVADRLGRDAIGIELNPQYAELARNRVVNDAPLFAQVMG